ncbi:hypothetical protein ACRAWF_02665 [Streptomyces sp. L7]
MDEFDGGEGAEVQMRGEVGGGVPGEVVVDVLVRGDPVAQPPAQLPAAFGLPAGRQAR